MAPELNELPDIIKAQPNTHANYVYFVRGLYYVSPLARIFDPEKHSVAKYLLTNRKLWSECTDPV